MSSRREFLKGFSTATAGMVAGSGLAGSAFALPQDQEKAGATRGKRKQIMVGGRKVLTVDLWGHIAFPDVWKAIPEGHPIFPYLQEEAKAFRSHPNELFDAHGPDAQMRLAAMDEMGIDVQCLNTGPQYHYWLERSLAAQVVRIQNEKVAELCAAYPDRFVGFASVALPFPDLAAEQLEEAVKKHGMRGAAVGGSVNGAELSDPRFDLFWAKAEQLGVPVCVRPFGLSGVGDRTPGQPRFGGPGWLGSVVGNRLEVTLAIYHLVEEGTLDRFPGLKIMAANGGGFITTDDGWTDQCVQAFPQMCKPVKENPFPFYLKRMYYDTGRLTTEGIRHLVAVVGASQVLLGTDNSNWWNHDAVDRIFEIPGLSDSERIGILGGSAARLLGIKS